MQNKKTFSVNNGNNLFQSSEISIGYSLGNVFLNILFLCTYGFQKPFEFLPDGSIYTALETRLLSVPDTSVTLK